jgi:hypothetical protein
LGIVGYDCGKKLFLHLVKNNNYEEGDLTLFFSDSGCDHNQPGSSKTTRASKAASSYANIPARSSTASASAANTTITH